MHRMEYYDFWRHYRVKAYKFKEARITFSRALEERTEDQYYVETKYEFPSTSKKYRMAQKTLSLVAWFSKVSSASYSVGIQSKISTTTVSSLCAYSLPARQICRKK